MRSLVALALATGIPARAWLDEDNRTIETAWELIEQRDGGGSGKRATYGDKRVTGG
jgi:hypothetical protein